jgi:hypothetical protein
VAYALETVGCQGEAIDQKTEFKCESFTVGG